MTQPEALRLADALRDSVETDGEWSQEQVVAAAAELRRLHASCEDYAQHKQRQDQRVLALTAQRDALLEALKLARSIIGHPDDAHTQLINAIIAKAKGELK